MSAMRTGGADARLSGGTSGSNSNLAVIASQPTLYSECRGGPDAQAHIPARRAGGRYRRVERRAGPDAAHSGRQADGCAEEGDRGIQGGAVRRYLGSVRAAPAQSRGDEPRACDGRLSEVQELAAAAPERVRDS